MFSFSFPNMFGNTTSRLVEDKEAIKSNIIALLSTEQNTLFGDPYFGCRLKQYIFEQSNSIIVDLLIDELYTRIKNFIPQVYIDRKMITVWTDDTNLFAKIEYRYMIDSTSDLFTIQLTNNTKYE